MVVVTGFDGWLDVNHAVVAVELLGEMVSDIVGMREGCAWRLSIQVFALAQVKMVCDGIGAVEQVDGVASQLSEEGNRDELLPYPRCEVAQAIDSVAKFGENVALSLALWRARNVERGRNGVCDRVSALVGESQCERARGVV